jgi:putative transcriptional regulator
VKSVTMSLRKLVCFATLATILIFPSVKTLQVHPTEFEAMTAGSPPHDNNLPLHASISHVTPPANQLVRPHLAFAAKGETSQMVLLPVQSKRPEDLGLGKLLVASRGLADPIFAKTVVLLVQYDADSVVGLMLNRRTDVPLSRVFEKLKSAKKRSDPVYMGGPVEIPAVFGLLRSKQKPESAEPVLEEVYLISTKSLFEKTLSARPDPAVFHVYLGYAGWTPDQLRKEVEVGAWFIFQGDAQTVFNSNPDGLWSQMIRRTELKLASNGPALTSVNLKSWKNLPLMLQDRDPIATN